jgi:uncharacterized SAM-binding protein YcdF (DUF218 family)
MISKSSLGTMARRQRHFRRQVTGPFLSFRIIAMGTLALLSCIGFALVFFSKIPKSNSNASFSALQHQRLFTDPNHLPQDLIASLDAILVLGGGAPESLESPPVYVQRRCDDAAKVVQRFQQGGFFQTPGKEKILSQSLAKSNETRSLLSTQDSLPILCLSAGTAHLPQLLSKDGLPIWESTSCAAYLKTRFEISNVYVETTSYDTIGNAFYTRTAHTDINGWRRLLIVTSEFHMDRTRAIFDWIFEFPPTSGKKKYDLYYLSSANVGLTEEAVTARREREAQSATTLGQVLIPKYKSLPEIYQFLTESHSLYTASKLVERARGTGNGAASNAVKQSYGAASANKNG